MQGLERNGHDKEGKIADQVIVILKNVPGKEIVNLAPVAYCYCCLCLLPAR